MNSTTARSAAANATRRAARTECIFAARDARRQAANAARRAARTV